MPTFLDSIGSSVRGHRSAQETYLRQVGKGKIVARRRSGNYFMATQFHAVPVESEGAANLALYGRGLQWSDGWPFSHRLSQWLAVSDGCRSQCRNTSDPAWKLPQMIGGQTRSPRNSTPRRSSEPGAAVARTEPRESVAMKAPQADQPVHCERRR